MDQIKASLQIGKSGVTDGFIDELKASLKKQKILKVRILSNAITKKSKKEIAEETARKVKAKLIEIRGNTFTLAKR
ncbi:MAG: YhbY family RNA-binding protein [Candidatus Altiarchaeota archaeon]